MMDARPGKFPHLDHFLNAYMHQDWDILGNSLEAVVKVYARDTSPEDVARLRAEINQFLQYEGSRVETDYHRLYPNSALPEGWHMTVAEWLRYVAKLAGEGHDASEH